MGDIPFRIVDLIMKYAGAYSQDKIKAVYLEDIKLIKEPMSVTKARKKINFLKYKEEINWVQLGLMIWGNTLGKYHTIKF
tara:strand:- start:312 stop:551 length:240 start_codon:yes stop_codon:yes gene_type:complete